MSEAESISRPNACAALRLLDPFSHETVARFYDVSFGATMPEQPVKAVVMQRLGPFGNPPETVEELVSSLQSKGTRLLYDIDDNLLDQHPDPASERTINARRRAARFLLRAADHVTVSTPRLRDRVKHLNPNVSVLPNALDEKRLEALASRGGRAGALKIGYFGTFTHLRDLMSVAAPLRSALSRLRGAATLELWGVSQDARMAALFEGFAQVEILPATGDYDSFITKMHNVQWDIGLAPLATGPFEATKSDIKFLEYAAFQIPGLYSDHPAYAEVEHGVTGIVATPDTWAENLIELAHNAELRERIVLSSRDYFFSNRTLQSAGHAWSAVVRKTIGGGE